MDRRRWDGGNDHGDELCRGSDGDVRDGGGDQRGGGEQHDDHGDDAGGHCGCGDGDGDQLGRTKWEPEQRVHLRWPPDGEQCKSEQRIDRGRDGGNDHGDELRRRSDGDVREDSGDQCSGGEQYDDHGDNTGRDCGCGDGDGDQPGSQSGSLASGFTYTVGTTVTPPGNFAAALMGSAAPTYIAGQQYYNATAGTTFTSSAFNSTGADLLIMFLGCHNSTVFTVTDSYGNTWLPLAGPAYKSGTSYYPMEGEYFYAPNATTGSSHTVTVKLSQTEPLVMSIAAFSGDNIYSPIDSYSSIAGDNGLISQNITSGPLTTSQPNDLLFGIVKGFGANTYTAGAGYTKLSASTGTNFSAETGPASSAGSYASNFSASVGDFWQTVIAAIAPKPNQSVLSWTASTGGSIANYNVERCAGLGCSSFSQIVSLPATTLTYTDTSISSGTVYNYRVRAENTGGVFSNYSSVQTLSPIIPRVVSSFAATPIRVLSWNASAESGGSISQYSIERCTGPGCSNFSQIATPAGTSYTDTSAAAGTTYSYRVRAQDSNGFYGPYSAVVPASIPAYFDNAADGGNNNGSTASLTYAYTVGSNSNRLLLVNVVGDPSVDNISSVKYAGTSLSLLAKVQTPSDGWHYLYYLLAPATGTNNVVITAGSSHFLISEASSWYNVAQSGQPGTYKTNTELATSGVSITTSLPATSNGAIVVESL